MMTKYFPLVMSSVGVTHSQAPVNKLSIHRDESGEGRGFVPPLGSKT